MRRAAAVAANVDGLLLDGDKLIAFLEAVRRADANGPATRGG